MKSADSALKIGLWKVASNAALVGVGICLSLSSFATDIESVKKASDAKAPKAVSENSAEASAVAKSVAKSASSHTLGLPEFIGNYLSSSASYQTSLQKIRQAEAEAIKSGDVYQSKLEITPSWVTSESNSSGVELTDQGVDVNGALTQATSLGTSFKFEYSQAVTNREVRLGAIVDSKYALGVSQPLYRNSFGRLRRLEIKASSAVLESQSHASHFERLQACGQARSLFANAWLGKKRLELIEKVENSAQEALRQTEAAARARLVRRMDLLAARADRLGAQSLFDEARIANEKAELSLNSYGGEFATERLLDPNPYYQRPLAKTAIRAEEAASLENLRLRSEAAESLLHAAQERAKTQVDLAFEGGRSSGRAISAPGIVPFEDSYAKVGVKIALPLWSSSERAEVISSDAEMRQAQLVYRESRRKFAVELAERQAELKILSERLERTKARAGIYDDLSQEAFKLIRSGKIEFEVYLRHRDRQLEEQLKIIDLTRDLWEKKSQLAVVTGDSNYLCLEEK